MNKIMKFNRIILFPFIIVLIVMCKKPVPNDEISSLNQNLDIMVTEQYLFLKSIEENNFFENVDSIYNEGNMIINQIEKGNNYHNSFSNFCKKFENENFVNNNITKINNVKSRIRLLQINYINIYLNAFLQSYFQVDLVEFITVNKEIRKNVKEKIEIFPVYLNRSNVPTVIINNDTLEYTGDSFLYNCFFEKSGEYFIETDAIFKRWGDTLQFNPRFKIIVK